MIIAAGMILPVGADLCVRPPRPQGEHRGPPLQTRRSDRGIIQPGSAGVSPAWAGETSPPKADAPRTGLSWPVLVLILTILCALTRTPAAFADPVGVISGSVVNLTASGASVGGTEVRLFVFRNQAQQAERITSVAADGSYRFEGVETATGYSYQVVATYGDLPYGTGALTFAADEREKSAKIEVYESTLENPGIYAAAASLIIAGVDPDTASILALEIIELVNPSDRAYRPLPGGPQGPMGLVRFSLPPGATDLTAHLGMAQGDVIQVDRGFATLAPLLPGSREFMYAYRFPYAEGKATFSKNLLFGAKIFTLLAVEGTGQVASPQLAPQERAEIQGNRYSHLQGSELAPGTAVEIFLSSLPQSTKATLPFSQLPSIAWAGAGIALAVAVVAVVGWRANSAASRLGESPPETGGRTTPAVALAESGGVPNQQIQELLQSLADLEDDYAAGAVAQEGYQEQRTMLQDCLKELVRRHGIHLLEGIPTGVDRERPK